APGCRTSPPGAGGNRRPGYRRDNRGPGCSRASLIPLVRVGSGRDGISENESSRGDLVVQWGVRSQPMRPSIHTVFRMARSRFFQESLGFTNARSAAFRTDSVACVYSFIVV